RQYEEMKALVAQVKEQAPYFDAPASLTRSIFSILGAQAAPTANIWQTLQDRLQHWLTPAFSAVALTAAVLLYVAVPTHQNPWMDEVVSEHVRSLMAEHLNDVPS